MNIYVIYGYAPKSFHPKSEISENSDFELHPILIEALQHVRSCHNSLVKKISTELSKLDAETMQSCGQDFYAGYLYTKCIGNSRAEWWHWDKAHVTVLGWNLHAT